MQFFERDGNALLYRMDGETVRVEPWGKDSLRVRAGLMEDLEQGSVALLAPGDPAAPGEITLGEGQARLQDGAPGQEEAEN